MILTVRLENNERITHPLIAMNGTHQTSYDLENGIVRDFLHNDDEYTVSDMTTIDETLTKVAPFKRARGHVTGDEFGPDGRYIGWWSEEPTPVVLVGNGSKFVVTDDNDPNFSMEVIPQSGAALVYNLIPNRSYTWVLKDAGNATLDSGTFTTSGTQRNIKINLPNFRDIGGPECEGGVVAYGKLYRGYGYLYDITDYGDSSIAYDGGKHYWRNLYAQYDTDIMETFVQLGITKDLDVRGVGGNLGTSHDYGSTYAHDPGYTDNGYNIEYVNLETYSYWNMFDVKALNVKAILEEIAETAANGGAIYLHCRTGADRTGTIVAILYGLLGVDLNYIVKEWQLTNMCGPGYEVRLVWMQQFFQELYSKYTSGTLQTRMTNWLKNKVGVTTATINALKTYMVEQIN